jgi:hypothetical protein
VKLTGTGLCLELNRAGVGLAVNRYRFVFGTEYSRRGACGYSLTNNWFLVQRVEPHLHPPFFASLACTVNFKFFATQQFNCANSCCAVCHNLCHSYSQPVAPFSPLIASSIQRTVSILYSTAIIQSVPSFLRTVSDQTANVPLNCNER